MITLRLDPALEHELTSTAKNLGVTRSDLIRRSIREYLEKTAKQNAFDAGQDLFGKYASGKNNLSTDRKVLLKKKVKAKNG